MECRQHSTAIILAIGCLFSPLTFSDNYNFNPGLWESTTTTEITGLPEEMAQMMTQPRPPETMCVKDLDDTFPDQEGCTYTKTRVSAAKMQIEFSCSQPEGNMTGSGEINYFGDTSEGLIKMNSQTSAFGPIQMTNKFKGKRIGDC